jgi:Zn-finger nucleic acid-binding protein
MSSGSCPRDGMVLEVRPAGEARLHLCGHCHGLWIGRADLERLAAVAARPALPPAPAIGSAPHHAAATIHCLCPPRPAMELRREGGLWIDVCPACGALWLDGGEIEEVLQRRSGTAGEILSGVGHFAGDVGGELAANAVGGVVLELLFDLAARVVEGVSDAL